MTFESIIAQRLGLKEQHVANTVALLQEGATIPFISRYRKEATGGMTDIQVAQVSNELDKLTELQKRREYIVTTIEGQGKLTPELAERIQNCWDSTELEDIYLPYKQKRRTRAQIAREAGLEPLAKRLMRQGPEPVSSLLASYKDCPMDPLQGAQDIIAEWVSENERARNTLRTTFSLHAEISSKVIKGKDA